MRIKFPTTPKWFEIYYHIVKLTPSNCVVDHSLDSKITIPVIEQTRIVSIKGPTIATSPDLIGSSFFDAPIAITCVPIPASFENAARLKP